jgi:hypothetical protein
VSTETRKDVAPSQEATRVKNIQERERFREARKKSSSVFILFAKTNPTTRRIAR